MRPRRGDADRRRGPASARPVGDPAIDDLLADVRDLRLSLAMDLSAAAGAVEDGAPDVATDFLAADRALLAEFLRRAREHLAVEPAEAAPAEAEQPAVVPAPAHRLRRLLPAAPALAAAAALVAILTGVVPTHGAGASVSGTPVAESWQHFSHVAGSDASAAQVIAAAGELHESLETLIAAAGHDPAKARQALHMLELERQLVLRDLPAGSSVVLAQSQALVARLAAIAPDVVAKTTRPKPAPPAIQAPVATPSPAPSAAPAATTTPKTTSAPSPSASPSPSPAKSKTSTPSPSSSPAASPTDIGGLPGAPTFSLPH